ncbi:hypothetical protein EVAR_27111_1 [Eumeta japonica]|uniref:Uncharacterized protein n=1 Tax=Eumeta variegata TaxID=151549 RepID=A0A4C1VKS5_EUMVA|nr:hypothetical protein EVAR_27111_1 [Eumeta japonica]
MTSRPERSDVIVHPLRAVGRSAWLKADGLAAPYRSAARASPTAAALSHGVRRERLGRLYLWIADRDTSDSVMVNNVYFSYNRPVDLALGVPA